MKTHYLTLFAILLALNVQAQATDLTRGLSIWFDTPNTLNGRQSWYNSTDDKEWENCSLPIGNGSFGGNILGSVAAERITLNEKSLWRGGPNTPEGASAYWNANKESAHLLPEIRRAFREGNAQKAAELTRKNFNGLVSYDEKEDPSFKFGNYTTMGEIYIETGLSEIGMSDYKRILSLDSALARVCFTKDGVNYERTYFASYPDSVMVLKFTADKPGMQDLVFSYGPNPESEGAITPDGDKGLLYTGKLKNNQMEFALRIQALHQGASA